MLILAFDSSTKVGSVALVNGDTVESEYTLSVQRTHAERLMPAIERVMADAGRRPAEIEAVVVGTGPGSFTGLRIAISTAKGLGLALGCPVLGVSTLDAMAWGLSGYTSLTCPMLDARRGEVYFALYRPDGEGSGPVSDYLAGPLAEAVRLMEAQNPERIVLSGDGARAHRETLRQLLGPRAVFPSEPLSILRGSWLVGAARQRLARGDFDEPDTLSPLYVRLPEAEVKWASRERQDEG